MSAIAKAPHLQPGADESSPQSPAPYRTVYRALSEGIPGEPQRAAAAELLRSALRQTAYDPDGLPANGADLVEWMQSNMRSVHADYQAYLRLRQGGAARRYFTNRAHALYFLRQVAPTKLVDGAWLYGLCAFSDNPLLSDLVLTYLEELGGGDPEKNHVALYRALLLRYGLDPVDHLPDRLYEQGAIQLALGWNAQEFFPEIVGFNLAYEQLPLHLLITAYELNELGIDPYYFTLHVTVDNADTGHARRACEAARGAAPRMDDGGEYWRRVRAGARLGSLGVGTEDAIRGFDIEQEVLHILSHKAPAGQGAHSDYCRVGGRKVNDWLANPDAVPAFLNALEQAGWIQKNRPVEHSRFWKLLIGDRAEMFGVFSPYELQVIHDWIRGNASSDGAAFDAPAVSSAAGDEPLLARPLSFRVAEKKRLAQGVAPYSGGRPWPDADLSLLRERLPTLAPSQRKSLLVEAMSPALHWTPAGLFATRVFAQQAYAMGVSPYLTDCARPTEVTQVNRYRGAFQGAGNE